MTFQPGVSLADDAEAVMDAAEALTDENYEATETFDHAAQVVTAMREHGEEMDEGGDFEGREEEADEAFDALIQMETGLRSLADGTVPDDVDEVRHHVQGLASAYAMRMLEQQLAAALGGL